MSKRNMVILTLLVVAVSFFSFRSSSDNAYRKLYEDSFLRFQSQQKELLRAVGTSAFEAVNRQEIAARINQVRKEMKGCDFWMRYLEPLAYKRINSPLPVEWETEVFEKFEKPYRRDGAGFTLASLCLQEETAEKDSLLCLLSAALPATDIYLHDSVLHEITSHHHFFLCNRLFLLNLAAIYTTGFECPDAKQVIPELRSMLSSVRGVYEAFNRSFPATPVRSEYLDLYSRMMAYTASQPGDPATFDHYTFIRDYVNPLFAYNRAMMTDYQVVSHNMLDYTLNKQCASIFDKMLYRGQNDKGIFHRVKDPTDLANLDILGKQLFYDPILSGNNKRSCASCHKSGQYFTDTTFNTSLHYNGVDRLARNTPSLVNAIYNHLLMLDGRHITLTNQLKDVTTNPDEMGGVQDEIVRKVMSCKTYRKAFTSLMHYTPQEKEVTIEHIASAVTFYYARFSRCSAPFDNAMNRKNEMTDEVVRGFNLFMGKAQCGTCHFVPQFNGVKPPYIGSEFEVLGVPADAAYTRMSADTGRYKVHHAGETRNAFRTGTIRNISHTAPYMHNGVFRTLEEVIDFYDAGGGVGHGFSVENQTLSDDSLHLTAREKRDLVAFMRSLDEEIVFEPPPVVLPSSKIKALNTRKVGGEY